MKLDYSYIVRDYLKTIKMWKPSVFFNFDQGVFYSPHVVVVVVVVVRCLKRKQNHFCGTLTTCSVFDVVQEEEMPEEVNIDDLLDLKTDEERRQRLQVPVCLTVSFSPSVCLFACLSVSQCLLSVVSGHLSLL